MRPSQAARGLLFGVFLRATFARPPTRPTQKDLSHVDPVVVGPRANHHVARRPLAVAHGLLLQAALVIEVVRLLAGALNGLAQLAQHELTGRRPAGVEVDGPENGLEGVGQDGGLGPAA